MRDPDAVPLTPRQIECLTLVAAGKTSAEIGHAMNIAARTVDAYIADACHRLGVRNRTHAVVKAMAMGWLTP